MSTKTEMATKEVSVKLIAKTADTGEKTVRAIVSSSNLDRDYDVVDNASLRLPLKNGGTIKAAALTGNEELDIPWLIDHNFSVENVIGSVRSAILNSQQELEVTFGVSSRALAQDVFTLLSEGHLNNAFSITFTDYEYQDNVIYNGEVLEISAVWRGANQDARLLALTKSLKGESMAEKQEDKPEVEEVKPTAATTEEQPTIEKPETVETVVSKPEEVAEVKPEATTEEQEVEEPAKGVEVPAEEVVTEKPEETPEVSKSIKKETTTMSTTQEIAAEGVVSKAPSTVAQPTVTKSLDKNAIRKNFVAQLSGIMHGDSASLRNAQEKAVELNGLTSKALDNTSMASLFVSTVVSQDILLAYTNLGRVGALVNHVDILGAETWKQIVESAGNGFTPVALGAAKAADQPVFSAVTFTPYEYALIVPWLDGAAQKTPIAVYNQVVRYIAQEVARLEDKIILAYAGGTVGSETRPATGLVPTLTAAGGDRVISFASYSSSAVIAALGTAYGSVLSDRTITLVANRATWAKLATALDGQGRPVFTIVGDQVSAGALGSFNVVTSEQMPADNIVIGDFSDYTYVTRGGINTLFSQEATVGSLNLFTSDASALRADAHVTGGYNRVSSFVLLAKASS